MSETSRYKKIVVPIDGSRWSERSIPHATDIAKNHSSEVILLHIFRTPANEFTDQIALAGQDKQVDSIRESTKQQLISLRNQLRNEGVECRIQFMEGMGVPHLICDYINEENVDLVIMSSHGRTGLGRFIFGSVARQVMEGVNVPVMIIRPGKDEK